MKKTRTASKPRPKAGKTVSSAPVRVAELPIVESVGEDASPVWRNRLIQSENVAALNSFSKDKEIAGQVTLVYLDPPFATNQDFRAGEGRTATISPASGDRLAYTDRLERDEYLAALRTRLVLVRGLLSDRGSIYLHIGHQMSHHVRVLMDEVFGPENFLNEITRIKCNPKNFRRHDYGNVKDTILFYSRSGTHVWSEVREPFTSQEVARLFPRTYPAGRRYTTNPLHAPGETRNGPTGRPWKGLRPPPGRHWRYDPGELDRLDREGLIEWSGTGNPRKILYADEIAPRGKKRQDIWRFKDPAYPDYPTEKNLLLLEMIVRASSNPDDLVLDCYAGSGTTLVAAEKLGRRWIGVDGSAVAVARARARLQELPATRSFLVEQ